MRIRVDPHLCAGHALCQARAPELFDLDVDNHSSAIVDVVPTDLRTAGLAAAQSCPEQAIVISEE
jgi:ferredoxin